MSAHGEELIKTLQEFEKFKVVKKKDSGLMKLIAFLLFFNKRFMTDFVTTIGNTMYTPVGWEDWLDSTKAEIVRHERVHLQQQKRYGMPLYVFLYLLWPLPLFYARGRTDLELEAYTESMRALVEHRGPGALNAEYKAWLIEVFSGSSYGWMCTDKQFLSAWFDQTAARVIKEAA